MESICSTHVNNEQVRWFQEQGFLKLGCLTTVQEIEWLREVYDEIIKEKTGYTSQELGHTNATSTHGTLLTIHSPDNIVPELKSTFLYRHAQDVFCHLFGVEKSYLLYGWRIFCKLAHSKETPWHQDAAYRPPPHRSMSLWLSLDPATLESSCLHYLVGSHQRGLLPHSRHDDHFVVDNIDFSQVTVCPLLAGEAVVHHCFTLHSAGPNKTSQPRRALAIVCQMQDSA